MRGVRKSQNSRLSTPNGRRRKKREKSTSAAMKFALKNWRSQTINSLFVCKKRKVTPSIGDTQARTSIPLMLIGPSTIKQSGQAWVSPNIKPPSEPSSVRIQTRLAWSGRRSSPASLRQSYKHLRVRRWTCLKGMRLKTWPSSSANSTETEMESSSGERFGQSSRTGIRRKSW